MKSGIMREAQSEVTFGGGFNFRDYIFCLFCPTSVLSRACSKSMKYISTYGNKERNSLLNYCAARVQAVSLTPTFLVADYELTGRKATYSLSSFLLPA